MRYGKAKKDHNIMEIWHRESTLRRVIRDPYKMSFDPEWAEMQEHYLQSARRMPLSFYFKHNWSLIAMREVFGIFIAVFAVSGLIMLFLHLVFGITFE